MFALRNQTLILAALMTVLVTAQDTSAQGTGTVIADRDCPGLGCPHVIANKPSGAAVYSEDDIVDFFKGQASCPEGQVCLPRSKTRAVCIGTADQCNQTAAAVDPAGFDLLITFELGSDRLSRQAQTNLAEFAKAMSRTELSSLTFTIDGHTDARGSEAFNFELSNRRAEAVVAYLETLGVPRSRLTAKGFGETTPRVDDPFAAINRRVEAKIRLE